MRKYNVFFSVNGSAKYLPEVANSKQHAINKVKKYLRERGVFCQSFVAVWIKNKSKNS